MKEFIISLGALFVSGITLGIKMVILLAGVALGYLIIMFIINMITNALGKTSNLIERKINKGKPVPEDHTLMDTVLTKVRFW